jgi:DNA-binding Lrp family transcriptional regulator
MPISSGIFSDHRGPILDRVARQAVSGLRQTWRRDGLSWWAAMTRKPCQRQGFLLDWARFASTAAGGPMVPFFVQIKCQLGKSYEVANKLADSEIASEIYSTAGEFDLLVKFYVPEATDIGHFINEKVQVIPGIQDTRTIITFKAF